MKGIVLTIIISLCLTSCLKDIEPLKRDNFFDPINITEPWYKLHSTAKVPKWNGEYYPYFTFEVTEDYLLNSNYTIGVLVKELGNNYLHPIEWKNVGDKLYFSFLMVRSQKVEKNKCFSIIFFLNSSKNQVGNSEFCTVI